MGGRLENWLVFGKYNKVQFWVIFGKSWGGACLVGEMFLHPVGVFLTYLGGPSSHIRKSIFVIFPEISIFNSRYTALAADMLAVANSYSRSISTLV